MPQNSVKRKDSSPEANGNNPPRIDSTERQKELEKKEREGIVIWRRPITTLEYFIKELFIVLYTYGKKYVTNLIVHFLFFLLRFALRFCIAGFFNIVKL